MMASSMLAGERRWTSTRKSGMTVLGKVPKPINLPSQKLENHGMDPNVEIVPKGALTWGSRPSSTSSNAWGSSALLSPRADGSVGSSNHPDGRPLSGGSGTRPSTGSSERSSEPSAISWGPSSRPSSASGIVPTSHMLVAANRPRSAETRPNSSQLSRFAEGSADSSSWGAAGTSEKMAAEASKRSDFTLSSGDFPTLGSEKIDEPKLLQGHSPKVSSVPESGLPSKGTQESKLNSGYGNPGPMVHGNFNSWSADSSSHTGEDASTRTQNWHKDNHNAQPLLDANMPARQFASWRGPPGQSPNVIWYGGHEAGGPYRPYGPRGSYHVDPYYPYVPAGALPNSQAFSIPEAIPGGMHFNKREAYGHMPPESYIAHSQSAIPVRPGVYPGPVLYEGFRGPAQTGFDNSSEHDVSTGGMPGHYAFHNQHLPENSRPQPWRFHTLPDGSASVMTKQQMISDQANGTQGQYKVLLKQHGNQQEGHTATVWPTTPREKLPCFSIPELDLVNCYKHEQTTDKQHLEESHSEHSNDLMDSSNKNCTGHNVMTKVGTESVSIRDQHNPNLRKNASLMEKVEGLNSKTRVIDVHIDGENFSSKERLKNSHNSKNNADHFENIGSTDFCSARSNPFSDPRNVGSSQLSTSTKVIMHKSFSDSKPDLQQSDEQAVVPDKSNHSEDGRQSKSRNQKRIRNVKGGVDHHYGKLKFGSYAADAMNNTPESDSLEKTSMAAGKCGHTFGSHASQGVSEERDSQTTFKSVNVQSSLESLDDDVQHAKLKELARQRAIELQKKELERTAERKAKAQAKLDELNRRTLARSKLNSRHDQPLCSDVVNMDDTTSVKDAKSPAVINETLHGSSSSDFQAKSKENDESIGDLAVSSFSETSRTSGSAVNTCPSLGEQSWTLGQGTTPEVNAGTATSGLQDEEVVSRRKQAGYRRRRNITDEHNQSERKTNYDSSGNTRSASIVIEGSDGLGNLDSEDSTFHHSSKSNHASKHKTNLCDTHLSSSLPSSSHLGGVSEKVALDCNESKPRVKLVEQMPEKNSDETMGGQDSFNLAVQFNKDESEACKETAERESTNWKPRPHRKPTRNLQSDRGNAKYQASDTVIWAPVKPVNKSGSSEQVHKSSASQVTNQLDGKNGLDIHYGAKAKRAEIERYVPKPIAKELSLQGDTQHSSPPLAPASFANMTGKPDPASLNTSNGSDISSSVANTAMTSMGKEDYTQNRQGMARASWRQRNSFEHEQSAIEDNLSFESSKFVEQPAELQHSRSSDEGGNGVLEETMMTTLSTVKNHGVSRQRRQQHKEHRVVDRSSYAPTHGKVMQREMPDKREPRSLGPTESGEKNHSRNENQSAGSGQVRSQWQPKLQVHPQNYLHGHKGSGGQRAADNLPPLHPTEKNLDESGSIDQRKNAEVYNAKFQESYLDRKVMKQPSKDENESDWGLSSITESASSDANSYQDSTGVHRRGYNRGRVTRGGDATYGGSQKTHSTGDRRNVEQNFEYRTGFNNKGGDMFQQNSSASEVVAETHRFSSGARYGMQGSNHSRHGGHFPVHRRGAAVRASSAYDVGG